MMTFAMYPPPAAPPPPPEPEPPAVPAEPVYVPSPGELCAYTHPVAYPTPGERTQLVLVTQATEDGRVRGLVLQYADEQAEFAPGQLTPLVPGG